ncbi:hypothetical protein LGV61_11665 [Desulfurispirillum indicum]|uniref:hypothetical protein n=1 Tax=Desulfurispirillum indicum TaxID=936456 RepID=UPI001CF9C91A|nr:hypothetical protein [Desulfurispirillum indicum]UCZ56374.1 hypothetical protein LGV61_11665 [Desulfurispirillum indicum]
MARRYVGTRWSFGKTLITMAAISLGLLVSPIITTSILVLVLVFSVRHLLQQRRLRRKE